MAYFDSVIMSLKGAVVIINEHMEVVFHNDTFANMAGRIGDSFVSRKIYDALPITGLSALTVETIGKASGEHNLRTGSFESSIEADCFLYRS
jgi:hypothetical protein